MNYANEGERITGIGMSITNINQMMTKTGTPIESPPDLVDYTLDVPFKSSTTTNSQLAIILDEYDFNILEDTKNTWSAPPPALWNLLMDDELDAVIEFTSHTIKGMVNEEVKTVLFVTHDVSEALFLSDQNLFTNDCGRIFREAQLPVDRP